MSSGNKEGDPLKLVYTNHQPLHAPTRRIRTPEQMVSEIDFLTETPGHAVPRPRIDLSGINGYPGSAQEQFTKWGHQVTPLFPETDIQPTPDQ